MDSTIDENGEFTGAEQSVNYMTQFQYYMFFLGFGGIILKYEFIASSGRIGKEVEYVIHGIEELSSHLIMKLKNLSKEDLQAALLGEGSKSCSIQGPKFPNGPF